jgi:hypothetical protein
MLTLGGRRIADTRTESVDLEDIGALYQAHRHLAAVSDKIEQAVHDSSKPLANAFEALVDAYNANVSVYNLNNRAMLDTSRFQKAAAALAAQLGSEPPSISSAYADIHAEKRTLETYKLTATRRIAELERARVRELLEAGTVPPSEPGFSLDPQWDVRGLKTDLKQLLSNPAVVVNQAQRVAVSESARNPSARSRLVTTAEHVQDAFLRWDGRVYQVPVKWRSAIERIIASVGDQNGRQVEKGAIVPFLKLKKELEQTDDDDASRLLSLLEHIESLHRVQCARYDGDVIKGTRVGMNSSTRISWPNYGRRSTTTAKHRSNQCMGSVRTLSTVPTWNRCTGTSSGSSPRPDSGSVPNGMPTRANHKAVVA